MSDQDTREFQVSYAAHEVQTAVDRFLSLAELHPDLAKAEWQDIARCFDKLGSFLVADEKKAA